MAHERQKLSAFPVFIRVAGRIVVIVGGGPEAFAKARLLAQTSARLTVVASSLEDDFADWIDANGVEHLDLPFAPALIDGAALVFAATGSESSDRVVVKAARKLGIPASAVDRPELCDFYTPAIVNRAPVAVAIGTEGAGPVLAQMIRANIERMLSPSLGRLAELAAAYREAAERRLRRGHARRGFWSAFFSGAPARAVEEGDLAGARRAATRLLEAGGRAEGHVALVGAGPGAEDLLTLRAHRLLMEADVILHDPLVPETLVAMGRRDAERINLGTRGNHRPDSRNESTELLVELARSGKRVVRLKIGDPLESGRASEELAALRAAGVDYEVVPGVSTAPIRSIIGDTVAGAGFSRSKRVAVQLPAEVQAAEHLA